MFSIGNKCYEFLKEIDCFAFHSISSEANEMCQLIVTGSSLHQGIPSYPFSTTQIKAPTYQPTIMTDEL